jgi:hypothetical protein
MASEICAFYASHGPMTELGKESGLIEPLPNDVAALARIIQGLGIYDVVARDFYGFDPPAHRLDEIHLRPIAERLARIMELDDQPFNIARQPERRVLQRCNSFALMLVAMLRAKGVPARSRCGFAAYFNPPNFEDHWVCEYWDAQRRRWRVADPQIDDVWGQRLGIRFDTLDLPRAQFLTAAEAWRRCRSGEADEQQFGISFSGLRGLWFVAASLVRDVGALNKMEMAPWDVWGAQPKPQGEFDIAFFDELAALACDTGGTFAELRSRYDADDSLRVPPTIFNALKRRPEAINRLTYSGPTIAPSAAPRGRETQLQQAPAPS